MFPAAYSVPTYPSLFKRPQRASAFCVHTHEYRSCNRAIRAHCFLPLAVEEKGSSHPCSPTREHIQQADPTSRLVVGCTSIIGMRSTGTIFSLDDRNFSKLKYQSIQHSAFRIFYIFTLVDGTSMSYTLHVLYCTVVLC